MSLSGEFTFTIDTQSVSQGFSRLEKRIQGLGAKILPEVAKVMAGTVNQAFLQGGVTVPWEPLAPATVTKRRRDRTRGRREVAGDDTDLRVSDRLRLAATDTTGRVDGSAYRLDTGRDIVQIGIDLGELPYGDTQQRGNPAKGIPARAYLVVTDETREEAQDAAQRQLNVLAADFERGTI